MHPEYKKNVRKSKILRVFGACPSKLVERRRGSNTEQRFSPGEMKNKALLLLVVCALLGTRSVYAQPQPGSPWPMMHHDQYHTSRSPHEGPETASLKWVFATEETRYGIVSSPVIAADGTIYLTARDGHLYAINPDGTEKWRFSCEPEGCHTTPAIGSDGTVYVQVRPSGLFAINPDGTLRWRADTLHGVTEGITIGSDGTIYVADRSGHIFAFNPDGTLQWEVELPDVYAFIAPPSVGPDGTIYIGDLGYRYLYAVTHDGSLKWQVEGVTGGLGSTSFSVEHTSIYTEAANGNSRSDTLHAIAPDGTIKWRFFMSNAIVRPVSIGGDGTIYFGSWFEGVGSVNDSFYAVRPDGSLKWSFCPGAGIESSAAIDSDGTVYFTTASQSRPGYVYALNPDGSLLWSYTLPAEIRSSPAIGKDGTLYVGCCDGKLYAFARSTGVEQKRQTQVFTYGLLHNRPNPFVASSNGTVIQYRLAHGGEVSLRVYDVRGRLVRTLVEESRGAGHYSVPWDGRDTRGQGVASGIYFYKLRAGAFTDTRKMALLR